MTRLACSRHAARAALAAEGGRGGRPSLAGTFARTQQGPQRCGEAIGPRRQKAHRPVIAPFADRVGSAAQRRSRCWAWHGLRWAPLDGAHCRGSERSGPDFAGRRAGGRATHNTTRPFGAARAVSCNGLFFCFRRKRRRTEVRWTRADLSLFTTKTVVLCESQYTPSGSAMPIMKTGSCCTRLPLSLISARWTACVL